MGAAGGDAPLLLALAALLAVAVATASMVALRRIRRGAAFGLGAAIGAVGVAGLAGLVVVLAAGGPEAVRGVWHGLPSAPPLPNIIRPFARTSPPVPSPAPSDRRGQATHVRDGDTIVVNGTPIRFANVDCAENGTLAGDRATAAMRDLVRGRTLRCDFEGRRSYDREVGICYLDDGRDLGGVLVAMGLCHWR